MIDKPEPEWFDLYRLKTGDRYWKDKAIGYTNDPDDAGKFSLQWLIVNDINLDGVTLERADRVK